jgi:hypothetical protein
MKILQRDWRGIYRHNFRYNRKQMWKDTENVKRKSQYKNSELNFAWGK